MNPTEQTYLDVTEGLPFEDYRAYTWPLGPQYKLYGWDNGLSSGGETEGWSFIGQFDARDYPIPTRSELRPA